ncbi:MAG: nucleoside-diphosphate sugar epimerase [Blastopirellula sp.]|nr:MAG: nucleoside-diphosphate sugar epimerase [Blastopirellula sp.]
MKIAITGGTGFVGRYLIQQSAQANHSLKCWYRSDNTPAQFKEYEDQIDWIPGNLDNHASMIDLLDGCDAVIHSAVWRPGTKFQGDEGNLITYSMINVVGTLALIEAARTTGVRRFVFLSSAAVHDRILDDRALDEKHPLWAHSHYGAYKAAVEKFVHSLGYGHGYEICSLRPTNVYGVANPTAKSKWYDLVKKVVLGEPVEVTKGGKQVHVQDVANAALMLLEADNITGEAYNCYDQYISEFDVAHLAKKISGSSSQIIGEQTTAKNQIDTSKIKALGMNFGGSEILQATIEQLVEEIQRS